MGISEVTRMITGKKFGILRLETCNEKLRALIPNIDPANSLKEIVLVHSNYVS